MLELAAKQQDAVCVAFSGGKDSMVVLDICARTFSRVEAFFMYLVPGLDCIEELLDSARKRYGITIRQYPHWLVRDYISRGMYCPNSWKHDELPPWKLRDIYTLARHEAGTLKLATGAKKDDGMWRRKFMGATKSWTDIIYPLTGWSKYDVLGYLAAKGLRPPDAARGDAAGIDLNIKTLLWLHDKHPGDFRKICDVFPYAEAVVYRRKWYGI